MNTLAINTITINQPIEEVFNFATNMENFKLWFPGVLNLVSDNSIEHGKVGKKYLETINIPFKGESTISLIVIESKKNEVYITEGDFFPLLPKMVMRFSEDSLNKTTFTWSIQSRNSKLMFKIFFLPVFKYVMNERAKEGLFNLKKILEK